MNMDSSRPLGSLTTESCSSNQPLTGSTSDTESESFAGRALRLTMIQTLTLIVTVSLTAAQFLFATFQLLPHARVGSTLAVQTYTEAAIALVVATAESRLSGEIEWVDAICLISQQACQSHPQLLQPF